MEKKSLVAVYGSLRKGLSNHNFLNSSKFIGTFNTEPIYSLYNLGAFPGLNTNGNTSITMEVYEVSEITLASIDSLEGYKSKNSNSNFYTRELIPTPFGLAFTYIYNREINDKYLIREGDWSDYLTYINALQC